MRGGGGGDVAEQCALTGAYLTGIICMALATPITNQHILKIIIIRNLKITTQEVTPKKQHTWYTGVG